MTRTTIKGTMLAGVLAGILLGPVLAGFLPVGDDPMIIYQPIKRELSQALERGRLPFWSDRIGLGVPLAAESHVAAFYPLNWLFYRVWDVIAAYRISMGLHLLALGAATFVYAKNLGCNSAGASLSAVSFTLCGFQAAHVNHEPFYHAMPYVLLCLLCADVYAKTGRWFWLAALALAWGSQITIGHFQIQAWTAGLVVLAGSWRIFSLKSGGVRPLRRTLGLLAGLLWGAGIACVQLKLTWELTEVAGFARPTESLSGFAFPLGHCGEIALPEVYLGRPGDVGRAYWTRIAGSANESCAYVGVVPLILAIVGAFGSRRIGVLGSWRMIVPVSLLMATLPSWWPDGFAQLSQIPGLSWFRAPARYTLVTSLGLALLAGRGLDESIRGRRFWAAFGLAMALGAAAWGWTFLWSTSEDFRRSIGPETLPARFALAGLVWILSIVAVIAWRRNPRAAWAPISLALLELGGLYYTGPIEWGRLIRLPEESPMLRRLVDLKEAGLIGGRLMNLPIDAGRTTAYPVMGIIPPPPNYMLEPAMRPLGEDDKATRRWLRRFGVTHCVWGEEDEIGDATVMAVMDDPVLDRVIGGERGSHKRGRGPWKLVRNRGAFPPVWISRRVREAESWGNLYASLSAVDEFDVAWFVPGEGPRALPSAGATVAKVLNWDGETAVVEHDGACVLVMRRAHYPGWVYRVNGGQEQHMLKVNGGLQAAVIDGSGKTRITVAYHPTGFVRATLVSLTALAASAIVLVVSGGLWLLRKPPAHANAA